MARSKKANSIEVGDLRFRKQCWDLAIKSVVVRKSIPWSLKILSMSLAWMGVWLIRRWFCVSYSGLFYWRRTMVETFHGTGSTSVDMDVVSRLETCLIRFAELE